jgi:REP element-mobilizing transposase RayT
MEGAILPFPQHAMTAQPLYRPTATSGAHRLHYSWSAWPHDNGKFTAAPLRLITQVAPLWKQDGLEVLEFRWTNEVVHILFAATPEVSPQLVAARAKGRLDHAFRGAGLSLPFSRKVSVRALGENTRRDVEDYLEHQVERERLVDPRFDAALRELQFVNDVADLSQPAASAHGRYWYNLHLVLVTDGRWRIREIEVLRQLRDATLKVAAKKKHLVSRLSILPDHLHAALRPRIEESPLDVAFAYLNNLAHMVGRGPIWQDGYYVGTFGEYSTHTLLDRAE